MPDFDLTVTRDQVIETLIAAGIVVGTFIVARLVALLLRRMVHLATHSSQDDLDNRVADAVRWPLVALLMIQGLGIAALTLSYLDEYRETLSRLWVGLTILLIVIGFQRVLNTTLTWYAVRQQARPGGAPLRIDPRSLPMVRRGVNIVVFGLGVLLIMDTLGISITPLVAGLGIGGIAVALALQPLLSQVFASSFLLSDSTIQVGDLIEIPGGPMGFVEDVGWRATRIRNFDNNIVIVPNLMLADSMVTNYDRVATEADAMLMCGVAYEEDLDHVERVSVEVLTAVRDSMEETAKDADPVFLFRTFGDSNIDILMKVRARDRRDAAQVQHEMLKRVHARFAEEGIQINYPARRLLLMEEDTKGLRRLLAAAPGSDGGPATE